MIFFIHIPKTAGTTFYEYIKHNHDVFLKPKIETVDNKEPLFKNILNEKGKIAIRLPGGYHSSSQVLDLIKNMSDESKQKISFIGGHTGYGIHEYFTQKVDYISFVRDPRERLISDFKEHHKKGRFFYEELKKSDFSFERYVELVKEHQLDNILTRQLAGGFNTLIEAKYNDKNIMLAKAIENLPEITFFNQSHFDDAIKMISEKFKFKQQKFSSKNISKINYDKPFFNEELVEDLIKYDNQLYKEISFEQYEDQSWLTKIKQTFCK